MSPHFNLCLNYLCFTVSNLAPGLTYTIEVSAFKKTFEGQPAAMRVKTDGKPLPQVAALKANVSKSHGTMVTVSWEAPQDDPYKQSWEYGIYYALNMTDLLAGMYDKPLFLGGERIKKKTFSKFHTQLRLIDFFRT